MITYHEFKKALNVVNKYIKQHEIDLESLSPVNDKTVNPEPENHAEFAHVHAEMRVCDTNCTPRLYNTLRFSSQRFGIDWNREIKMKDLSNISVSEFLKCRNVGVNTVEELKEMCFHAGVTLQP
jgi:hypothetical protein